MFVNRELATVNGEQQAMFWDGSASSSLREKHRFVTGTDDLSVTGIATVTVIGLLMTV